MRDRRWILPRGYGNSDDLAEVADYVRYSEAGTMLFLSGQGPSGAVGKLAEGGLSRDFDIRRPISRPAWLG